MPTLKYLGDSYDCATAIKGPDYIHLLDANGAMVATFDKITDFSSFTLENGSYTSPTPDHDCYLTVTRDDGTFGKGNYKCSDIPRTAADVGARPNTWTPSAADVGAVPTSRTVNGKALSGDISLTASDVGASASGHKHTKAEITDFPTSMPASDVYSWAKASTKPSYTASEVGARPSTWTPSAADVGAVPTSRTINNKALSANISLSAADVGARPSTWTPSASDVGAAPSSHNQAASTITAGTLGGKVQANASAAATLGNAQVRDIYAGTSDMTAGSSSLTTGTIYFVYEA